MITTPTTDAKISLPPNTGNDSISNVSAASADAGWPVPEFKHNLGDNPLWDEFMEEMKKNHQADIAEANRQADLELKLDK